jgi:protein-S-isoprenylcysteine O-methyltransferase Ste14
LRRPDFLTTVGLAGLGIAVVVLLIGLGHSLILILLGREAQYRTTPGHWDLLVASVAVFMVFLLLIPAKVTADWRNHGAYAAFFVSLFAEMFGFPLTVYFLSAWLSATYVEPDFIWYVYYLGTIPGVALSLVGIALIVLGWRQVYGAKDGLATGGVYKYMRHPQFLGIVLLSGGWLIHWPTIPGALIYPILVILYYKSAKREDRYLAAKFGDAYTSYAQKTPLLIPRFSAGR